MIECRYEKKILREQNQSEIKDGSASKLNASLIKLPDTRGTKFIFEKNWVI